ncbi:DUF2333 family protein [Arthrobacter cryoconiti]|uniref:DUF2333 family protein n=1 Tax=Arthrobacter cryoconiti TaxID=748907 RepID=A0ABV8R6Y0_9MICC|nr:DUF2333 family protein [Arthrobacter cryoconiti]MCC9069414.1 DUF2333 family protein [Arthrobacter cryoconiti]
MMGDWFGMVGWWWAIGLLLAIGLVLVIIRGVRAAGDDSVQNNSQEPRGTDSGAAETPGVPAGYSLSDTHVVN